MTSQSNAHDISHSTSSHRHHINNKNQHYNDKATDVKVKSRAKGPKDQLGTGLAQVGTGLTGGFYGSNYNFLFYIQNDREDQENSNTMNFNPKIHK